MREVSRGLVAWLFFVVLAAAAIGANPFAGQTSTPLDLLARYDGFGGTVPRSEVRHPQRSDALDARLPQWEFAKRELRSGRLPLWNPTSGGGDASLLKPTSGQLTPAFAIFSAVDDSALGFYLSVLFNLSVAGAGMYFFLRRHVAPLPAAFGAVMFQLCGFIAGWLYWSHVLTIMWTPWLLWALTGLVREGSPKWFAASALSTALLVLGGFPFVAQLALGAAGLYVLVMAGDQARAGAAAGRARWRLPAGRALLALGAVAFGFFLVLIPLLTLVHWLGQFDIGHRGSGSHLRIATHFKYLFYPWAHASTVEKSMYVGTLGAVLGLLGIWRSIATLRRATPLAVYSLLLFVVGLVLSFEVVPRGYLAFVPGLGYNGWSRALSLLDLSFAMAAASLLHGLLGLFRSVRGVVVVVAFGLLAFAVQGYDQIRYFREFNGYTSADNYYPVTPAIAYVREHAGPFDHVVADRSYLYSGSLGGYGINEWFAHRFKGRHLKQALSRMAERPFNSPTSSSLRAWQLNPDASQFATLNVRYLMLASQGDTMLSPVAAVPLQDGLVALPRLPAGKWRQPLDIAQATTLGAIDVRLATYRARDLDGEIALEVRDEAGELVASMSRKASQVRDNKYFRFGLKSPRRLDAGRYFLLLAYAPGERNRSLTAWSGTGTRNHPPVEIEGVPSTRVLDYRLHKAMGETAFRKVGGDQAVTVWENPAAPAGPYFLDDAAPEEIVTGTVEVRSYVPARFELQHASSRRGRVVVPMGMTDDWRVTVDGEPVAPGRVEGLLPAVPVDGNAAIVFEYRPRALAFGKAWLLCVLLAAGVLVAWQFRRRRAAGAAARLRAPRDMPPASSP